MSFSVSDAPLLEKIQLRQLVDELLHNIWLGKREGREWLVAAALGLLSSVTDECQAYNSLMHFLLASSASLTVCSYSTYSLRTQFKEKYRVGLEFIHQENYCIMKSGLVMTVGWKRKT